MKRTTYQCAVSGALAGAANGLFGAGGGMILVPLLTRWAKLDDRTAFSSAICMIAPMCVVSLTVYGLRGALPMADAVPYLIGGFLGGLLGGVLFKKIPTTFLHKALGLLILYGGVRALF